MKCKLASTIFIIGSLLTPVISHASGQDMDRSHPEAYAKDSLITTKIKAKLADEKMSSLIYVKVDTANRGGVILSGEVKSRKEANKAVSIARETEGVTSVKSYIKIHEGD
ncbi:BON domain-containing protein [Neisseriaceae bacterium JH1-16]|nr:BON domain-containing protein [Neisseriaceae bacterium JH1-16]